jgi:hypothetical protein
MQREDAPCSVAAAGTTAPPPPGAGVVVGQVGRTFRGLKGSHVGAEAGQWLVIHSHSLDGWARVSHPDGRYRLLPPPPFSFHFHQKNEAKPKQLPTLMRPNERRVVATTTTTTTTLNARALMGAGRACFPTRASTSRRCARRPTCCPSSSWAGTADLRRLCPHRGPRHPPSPTDPPSPR